MNDLVDRLAVEASRPSRPARCARRAPTAPAADVRRCGGRHRGHLHRPGGRRRRGAKVPSTPDDPAGPWPTRHRRAWRPTGAGPRHHRRHQRAARAAAGATVALVTNDGLRRRDRDRPPGPAVALRPVGRPARAAGGPRPPLRGARPAGRRRHRARAARPRPRCRALAGGVEAVAVCLLHADLDPAHERAVAADAAPRRGFDVTALARGVARVPRVRAHRHDRGQRLPAAGLPRPTCTASPSSADEVLVMTSAGGLVPAAEARRAPGRAAAVGPGRRGAGRRRRRRAANGWPDAITFDMGGTSTDVCLVLDGGGPSRRPSGWSAGSRCGCPSLDVHTIGAGGGSIARVDAGGALRGRAPQRRAPCPGRPATAGAGTEPTVTDADLVAGRIPADVALPGHRRARRRRGARGRWPRAGVDAEGVIAVVDAAMEQALRAVSVERGVDPRGLALVAFGGAGPLHACALADALGHAGGDRAGPGRRAVGRRASSRAAPGATSCAVVADPLDHDRRSTARRRRAGSRPSAADALGGRADGDVEVARPRSTAATPARATSSRVADVDDFRAEHERRNGYARPDAPVEVVAVRAVGPAAVAGRPSTTCRPSSDAPLRRARRWSPSPTARSGCPRAGGPSPAAARRCR